MKPDSVTSILPGHKASEIATPMGPARDDAIFLVITGCQVNQKPRSLRALLMDDVYGHTNVASGDGPPACEPLCLCREAHGRTRACSAAIF